MPNIQKKVAPLFLRRLLRSPQGRTFVMTQASQAEGSDEGRVFDELLARVDDDKLKKMVRIHQEDEERHAEMFAEAAARAGAADIPFVPEEKRLLPRLDAALGGFFDQFQAGERTVTELYALLQVIEERAMTQFKVIEPILREIDPVSAETVQQVINDEERHLKYCRAIGLRYAESEEDFDAIVDEFRRIEAQVFGDMARFNMALCLDRELVDLPAWERPLWRALQRLSNRRKLPVPSDYAPQPTVGPIHALFKRHAAAAA